MTASDGSGSGIPDRKTASYKATTPAIALIPLVLLMIVFLVISNNRTDYKPFPSYDREYPALQGTPTPFDVASLPYTLTIPAGLTTMPNPGEGEHADATFAPETWFPTKAGIKAEHQPLEGDFTEILKKNAGSATITDLPTADPTTTAHTWTDGGTEHVYISKNGILLTLRADQPQDGTDTTGSLAKALREMTASVKFRA
ncbi:hypothetical protein Afil01_13920 [Actinorhabdospora filicis]|uniref:DUF4245 domain-containing protein n=1 Tax=Actinorhabdospora filicis TaxID=1785913 RepID=A0A9W6SG87_9ACTN|nr:hypothetical protein [Actinorhabdospora filicis]GLZ76585.1 hypothetical protein Afil01_13920 [Actinorhabdospora filicis]